MPLGAPRSWHAWGRGISAASRPKPGFPTFLPYSDTPAASRPHPGQGLSPSARPCLLEGPDHTRPHTDLYFASPAPRSSRLDHDHLSAGVDESLWLDMEPSPNLTDLPAETTQPVVPLVGVRVEHASGHVDDNVGRKQLEKFRSRLASSCEIEKTHDLLDELDVLLRHRRRSIARWRGGCETRTVRWWLIERAQFAAFVLALYLLAS
jgi:hypothetical protein